MPIVDLATAKEHLRILHDLSDPEIIVKLEQASAVVIDYLKKPVGTWEITDASGSNADDAPWPVQAAVLLVVGELMKQREAGADPISQGVKDLLVRYRKPALA